MSDIRIKNNGVWMRILQRMGELAPMETANLIREIVMHDSKVDMAMLDYAESLEKIAAMERLADASDNKA